MNIKKHQNKTGYFLIIVGIIFLSFLSISKLFDITFQPNQFNSGWSDNSYYFGYIDKNDASLAKLYQFDGVIEKSISVSVSTSRWHQQEKYSGYVISITIDSNRINEYYEYLLKNNVSDERINLLKKTGNDERGISQKDNYFTIRYQETLSADESPYGIVGYAIYRSNIIFITKIISSLFLILLGVFLLKYKKVK